MSLKNMLMEEKLFIDAYLSKRFTICDILEEYFTLELKFLLHCFQYPHIFSFGYFKKGGPSKKQVSKKMC